MKKCLAALTAIASASAFAQSYVGISGLLDDAVTVVKSRADGQVVRKTGLFPSGMSSNFLRFDGREDLGHDWSANFRLESGLNTDTGLGIASNSNNQRSGAGTATSPLTFNRWAYAGLANKSLGEIRAGRVYTAAFENFTPYDPFLTNGIGSSTAISLRLGQKDTQTALNVSNAIEYLTPHYNKGLFARVTVALGENPSDGSLATSNPHRGGEHEAVRVGYAAERWSIAYSAGLTHNTAGKTPTGNNAGDYLNTNLSGRYDFGMAMVEGQYVTEKLDGASAAGGNLTGIASNQAKTRTFLVGLVVPVGAGNIKFSYVDGRLTDNIGSAAERGKLYAVGYDYFLSKRTNLYTVYSRILNNEVGNFSYSSAYVTAGQGQASSGLSVGMRHLF
jgi:predicted porin